MGYNLEASGECPPCGRGLETVRTSDKIKQEDVLRICWNGKQGRKVQHTMASSSSHRRENIFKSLQQMQIFYHSKLLVHWWTSFKMSAWIHQFQHVLLSLFSVCQVSTTYLPASQWVKRVKLFWFIPWKKRLSFCIWSGATVCCCSLWYYLSLDYNDHYSSWQVSDFALPDSAPDFQGFHPWGVRDFVIQLWPKVTDEIIFYGDTRIMMHLDMNRDEINHIFWRTFHDKDKGQENFIPMQN